MGNASTATRDSERDAGVNKRRFAFAEELFSDFFERHVGDVVEDGLLAPSLFLLSGTKAAKEQNSPGLPKVAQRRTAAAVKGNCAFPFQFCSYTLSQSRGNLLIIP